MTDAHLYREITVRAVVPFPGVTMHFLRNLTTGGGIVLIKGGTRTERDNARLMTNYMLREGGRQPFPFVDEEDMEVTDG